MRYFLLLISFLGLNLFSQVNEPSTYLLSSNTDFFRYYKPLTDYISLYSSSSWYNNAKTHKPLGFDLMINTSLAIIPDDSRQFIRSGSAQEEYSSVFGLSSDKVVVGNAQNGNYAFVEPNSKSIENIFSNSLTFSFGLFKGSEIILKYMIPLKYSFGKASSWGIAYKNDLFETFNAKFLPIWGLSIFASYNSYSSANNYNFSKLVLISDFTLPNYDYSSNKTTINSSVTTIAPIIGLNFPIVSFFGSLGLNIINNMYKFSGEYLVKEYDNINLMENFNIKEKAYYKIRLNAGMRLRFGLAALRIDYNYSNFSLYSLGLGLTLR